MEDMEIEGQPNIRIALSNRAIYIKCYIGCPTDSLNIDQDSGGRLVINRKNGILRVGFEVAAAQPSVPS
jgi:hypothetical protein